MQIKVIGVPEHFNLPWLMAIDEGAFTKRGIDLIWQDIPEGTGRMAKMLADEEADLAIILTEGIVKSISEGNPSKIIQTYVESPLLWGIHVAAKSPIKTLNELKRKKAAISRFGSGSHLMSFINAENNGWPTNKLEFEVVHNLNNAIQCLQDNHELYFMWEHFTTKPLVDAGTFKRLGDCPTPWPCFVVAATNKIISEQPSVIKYVLEVINGYTAEFKRIPSIDRTLANKYVQKLEDIQQWLANTFWGQEPFSSAVLKEVQERLHKLELISTVKPADLFLTNPK